MLKLQALVYIEENDRTGGKGGAIWNYATGTLTSRKGAKPDCVIQLNCGKVHTHASYETTRTGELQQPRNKNDPPSRQTMITS